MVTKRQPYPSDISREQFELIREDLEGAKKTTKPRKVDLYDIFCAVLYVLTSGCQWRMLPHDFPKASTVYYYFRLWSSPVEEGSILKNILKKTDNMGALARLQEREELILHFGCPKRKKHG